MRIAGLVALGLVTIGGAACAIRTPGRPATETNASPASGDLAGPAWRATDPLDPTESQPRGFAVLGPDRRPIDLERRPDEDRAALWQPVRDLPVSIFSMIDDEPIASIEAWIAVLELAEDDPARRPEIPPRRAVDGLLATPKTTPARGLAIVLGSLARLNPPEQWLTAELLERGWVVLVSSPPVAAPDSATDGIATLAPGLAPVEAGETLAAEVDTSIGAWRDGLASILRRLEENGSLPEGPTVILGASSGAIAAPLLAARLREDRPISAMVLVAGGASPPRILARTTLTDEDLRLDRRGPRVDDHDLPRFIASFESASRLLSPASENAASDMLRNTPVLLLEAGFDSAIPEAARSRLRSLHPTAARWWYPLGHVGLFIALGTESGPIVTWIERETSNRTPPGADDLVP